MHLLRNGLSFKPTGRGIIDQYRFLIMALALNVPLIYMILFMDIGKADLNALSWFYISCVIVGYYVLPLLLIASIIMLSFFAYRNLPAILTGMVSIIFIFYLLVDYFVYTNTKIHLDPFWLEFIVNDYQAFGLPSGTFRNLLLVLVGIVALELGIFYVARSIKKRRFIVLMFIVLVLGAFGISQMIHIFAYDKNYQEITNLTPRLPVYYPIISRKHAVKYEDYFPVFEPDTQFSSGNRTGSLRYPLREMNFDITPDSDLPNIVVLFLESWRTDMMDAVTTPNIFALSGKSTLFTDHFCSGNSTVAGVFGFFYGIHPTYWTAVKANSVMIDNPVFIDVLKDNDYAFGVYAKSNFKRHKIKDTVFRGIDVVESFKGNTIIEQDADMTEQVKSFLRDQKESSRRFMLYAFFKSDHFPYHYPPEDSIFLPATNLNFMLTTAETDPTNYINDCRNSNHYVDRLIGEIIAELDSLGDMQNTIVIVTTDHSDEFNDNGANYWGHGTNFTRYQVRVPLIVYFPDREPQEIDYVTSHIDVVPTILQDYFGCENDMDDYSNGRDLFARPERIRPLVVGGYVNHAFIIGDDVYEIYPVYTKKYKLDDINGKASRPPSDVLAVIQKEINRFYTELAMNGR